MGWTVLVSQDSSLCVVEAGVGLFQSWVGSVAPPQLPVMAAVTSPGGGWGVGALWVLGRPRHSHAEQNHPSPTALRALAGAQALLSAYIHTMRSRRWLPGC